LVASVAYAQPPDGFNYQAVVRDGTGEVIANDNVTMRFTVIETTASGGTAYQEIQSLNTNQFGLVSAVIGQGNVITGTFADIEWGSDKHYLKVEVNTGPGYQFLGTAQLMSVPYALSAGGQNWESTIGNNIQNSNIGNVGIGTSTPTARLEVSGDVNKNQIRSANGTAYIEISKNINDAQIKTNQDHPIYFQDGSAAQVYFTGGSVGFGTDVASSDIHIKSSDSPFPNPTSGGITFENEDGSNEWQVWHSNSFLSFAFENVRVAYISNSTGDWVATSDERFKKDIEPAADILDKVMELKTVKYRYIQNADDVPKSIGFLAQDVQKVFPDLIHTEDGSQLALARADFGVLSIKAIQEQQQIIEEQQKQIDELREAIVALQNR